MSDEAVRYAVKDAVATLTMDQPHNRNALTPALMAGLAQGLESALADESVGVIVLTNHGPVKARAVWINVGFGENGQAEPGQAG